MLDRSGKPRTPTSTQAATLAAAMLMWMMAAGAGWPQSAPPSSAGVQTPAQQAAPQQADPAPSPPPTVREENPGLLNEMGRMFEKSLSILPTLKTPAQTMDDLNATAKDAGDALTRMAKPSSMVTGRTICPVAANGAPDCKVGADKLCQSEGFKEGKPQRRFLGNLLAESVDSRPGAKAGRLQDR
jgi:hypothetical protein